MTCPDEFVVGYGMDYASQFRSLPVVAVLKRSVYE
jgi:hypoxanthine phosphoribosyltransferase